MQIIFLRRAKKGYSELNIWLLMLSGKRSIFLILVYGRLLILYERFHPKKAFITHISHQMGFHAEVTKELPPEIMLAYDGLSLLVNE